MLTDEELQIARHKREFTVDEAACYWMDEDPHGLVGEALEKPVVAQHPHDEHWLKIHSLILRYGKENFRDAPNNTIQDALDIAEAAERMAREASGNHIEEDPDIPWLRLQTLKCNYGEEGWSDARDRYWYLRRLIFGGCEFTPGVNGPTGLVVKREELITLASKLAEEGEDMPRFLAPSKVDEEGLPIQPLSDSLDPSISIRLNAMIEAANQFWGGVEEGTETLPLNKTVAAWMQDKTGVAKSLADSIATVIRPDWAKDRTWKNNKKR